MRAPSRNLRLHRYYTGTTFIKLCLYTTCKLSDCKATHFFKILFNPILRVLSHVFLETSNIVLKVQKRSGFTCYVPNISLDTKLYILCCKQYTYATNAKKISMCPDCIYMISCGLITWGFLTDSCKFPCVLPQHIYARSCAWKMHNRFIITDRR